MTQHIFYDDGIIVDLRYLVAAEIFDFTHEENPPDAPYGIGFLLEVGSTPKRLSTFYRTVQGRDEAFVRLIALHVRWMQGTHRLEINEFEEEN